MAQPSSLGQHGSPSSCEKKIGTAYSNRRVCASLYVRKTVLPIMASESVPELTRISSKGQVVIPARVRSKLGIKPGSLFAILTRPESGLVVLKKVDNKTLHVELGLLREVEKAWKEIAEGKTRKASRKRFLEELQTW